MVSQRHPITISIFNLYIYIGKEKDIYRLYNIIIIRVLYIFCIVRLEYESPPVFYLYYHFQWVRILQRIESDKSHESPQSLNRFAPMIDKS